MLSSYSESGSISDEDRSFVKTIIDTVQPGKFPHNFELEVGQWMIVDHPHRLIHIHIPKTGGSTVNAVLEELGIEMDRSFGRHFTCHRTTPCLIESLYSRDTVSAEAHTDRLQQAVHLHQRPSDPSRVDTYRRAIKFSMIRNPYEMLLSTYHYQGKKGDLTWGQGIFTFEDFIRKFCDYDFPWRDPFRRRFLFHQIFEHDGKPGVHYVIRSEHVEEGLGRLLHAAGILHPDKHLKDLEVPHLKVSPQMQDPNTGERKNWQDFYTEEMKELVQYKCARELAAFGYDFNGPTDGRVLFKPTYMYYRRDPTIGEDGGIDEPGDDFILGMPPDLP